MSLKILVLEDEKLLNETLEDFLQEEGYSVSCALDPYTALDLTYKNRFDLYLFDVNLPYENGFDLLTKLRKSGDMTPTIFLTSRDDKESLRAGYKSGGDDYIKKPIDLDELLLRIEALLRRQSRSRIIEIGNYRLDMHNKRLFCDDTLVEMSQKTIELLMLFAQSQGETLTIERIKSHLWATSETSSEGAIRVYIAQLKKYFPKHIVNIRGVGYRFEELR